MSVSSSSSEIHDFLRRGETAVFHMLSTCPLNTEAGLVFPTSLNGKGAVYICTLITLSWTIYWHVCGFSWAIQSSV